MKEVQRNELTKEYILLKQLSVERPMVYNAVLTLLSEKGLEWCRNSNDNAWKRLVPYANMHNRFYKLSEDEQKATLAIAKTIADSTFGNILFQNVAVMQEQIMEMDLDGIREDQLVAFANKVCNA